MISNVPHFEHLMFWVFGVGQILNIGLLTCEINSESLYNNEKSYIDFLKVNPPVYTILLCTVGNNTVYNKFLEKILLKMSMHVSSSALSA